MIKVIFQRFDPGVDVGVIALPKDGARDTNEIDKLIVTGRDLANLMNVIQAYLPVDDLNLDSVVSSLIENAKLASAARFSHTHLPFLLQVVSKNIPVFLTTTDTPTSIACRLVSTLLLRYIVDIIGSEPACDADWCRPAVGSCSCSDCQRVNAILRSDEIAGGIKVSKARRHHLHTCFSDRNDGSYSIETDRTTNPNGFRIIKNVSRWQKEKNERNKLVEEGRKWLGILVAKGLTKEWLEHEEDYEDFIALRAGLLKKRKSERTHQHTMATTTRLVEERGNALREGTGNPMKRAAEGTDDEERRTKRNAGGEGVQQNVEVVDLTED